ncbi:MAG: extracellular solute-binding protein, partial [Chloroflexota bacterium]|nr:extracellular solute-binding protein [Chloroflexota bacterium]
SKRFPAVNASYLFIKIWRMLRPYPCLLAGTALFFSLAACSAPVPSRAPTTDSAPVTLTVWHTQTGTAGALLNALANDFHQAYPSITVRAEAKTSEGDLLRQGIAGLALNQLPDVIIANNRTIGEFARKDALVALEPFLDDATIGLRAEERSDFLPGLLDSGRFPDLKNKLFAFPFDESAVVLYYNADLLLAAKVDTPPRTWDQFSAAARATTRGSTRGWATLPDAAVFSAFLFSRGSGVLNDAQTQVQFNDDAGTKSLQMIAALSKGGSAYLADRADAARADFAQSKTALLFGTTDDLAAVSDAVARANANFQWGVSSVPQNDPSHPLTAIFGANIAIFKPVSGGANGAAAERSRAAWLFARWLAEPEQTARWSRPTLSIPLRASALPLLAANAPNPVFQRLRDGFGGALPSGRALPAVKDAAQIDAAVVELWVAGANGTDTTVALSRAVTRVSRILGP